MFVAVFAIELRSPAGILWLGMRLLVFVRDVEELLRVVNGPKCGIVQLVSASVLTLKSLLVPIFTSGIRLLVNAIV